MPTVTFPEALNGDGFTYTDGISNGAIKGLSGGGHRDNFIPILQNVVNIAQTAKESAGLAVAALDSFEDRYLGEKVSDPLTDNDGNPLQLGAIYFRTSSPQEVRVYTSLGWRGIGSYTTGDIRVQGSVWTDTIEKTLENLGPINNTYVLNIDLYNAFKFEVNGNLTLSFANTSPNVVEFKVELKRIATATVSWPISLKWEGGMAPSFDLNKTYVLYFYTSNGVDYFGKVLISAIV